MPIQEENGAVLARGAWRRRLAAPVPAGLAAALSRRGVACRRGAVLLACSGADEQVVLAEVRRLGLECQLIRNRAELMVLPAGVSKGTARPAARCAGHRERRERPQPGIGAGPCSTIAAASWWTCPPAPAGQRAGYLETRATPAAGGARRDRPAALADHR